jgi:hypothetical protein
MKNIKKSIFSIMMLFAAGTATAQVPATELTYPRPERIDDFGSAVAVYDHYTLASSEFENNTFYNGGAGTYHGTIRLFSNNQYVRTYTYGNGASIGLGTKNNVAIGSQCIAAGAPSYITGGASAGIVIIANKLSNGEYHSTLNYHLLPDANDVVAGLQFGQAVATDGDWIAVGAPGRNNSTGGVCMFQRTGYLQWTRRGWISATGLQEFDSFGKVVKLSGDQLIVTSGTKVHIYKLINGTWTSVAQLSNAFGYGYSQVDITANHAVASTLGSNGEFIVQVFKKSGTNTWTLNQTLNGPDRFGLNVAISGSNLIISNNFKVFYYQLQGNLFVQIGSIYIPAANTVTKRQDKITVGNAIDIHNDRTIVAAVNSNYEFNPNAGAVFTDFFWNGWANSNNLRSGETEMENASGFSVYPNPSASNISVNSEGEILKATATNVEGEKMTLDFYGKTLVTEGLSTGMYVLNVETTTGSFTTKFVKQ